MLSADVFNDGYHLITLADALTNARLTEELVKWYMDIFNDEREWGEHWTADSAYGRVFGRAEALNQGCMIWRVHGQLAAASLFQVGSANHVYVAEEAPEGLNSPEQIATVLRHLSWFYESDRPLIYFRDLGVRHEHRGSLGPLMRLVIDPTARAVRDHGVDFACLRTSRDSRLFPLMAGFDMRIVYDFGDSRRYVIMGDHPSVSMHRFLQSKRIMARMVAERLKINTGR